MAKNKNPLDDIVDELVVFRMGEGGEYACNSPIWNDRRIREHWLARYSDEATAEVEEDEEELPEYETWTNQDLRSELVSRGLSVDGKKDELVTRLQEDDAKEA